MILYLPDILSLSLEGDLFGRFLAVRVRVGDRVQVTDLKGNLADIEVILVDKKRKLMAWKILGQPVSVKSMNPLVLYQAIPDRLYLEKLMEILPLSPFTDVQLFWSDRCQSYTLVWDRLYGILRRGCEQSERPWLPNLSLTSWDQVKNSMAKNEVSFLSCPDNATLVDGLQVDVDYRPVRGVVVGPEGGWSLSELKDLMEIRPSFCSLGSVIYPSWLAGFVWSQRTQKLD